MSTDLDNAKKGTCENCNTEDVWLRRVESTGGGFGSAGRGFFDICFDCDGPVKYWFKGQLKMESPLSWPKEKVQDYLNKKVSE